MNTVIYDNEFFHIKRLLDVPSESDHSASQINDFSKILEAQFLARLLANATLTAPKPNKVNIKAFIDGKLGWPCKNGSKYFYPPTKHRREQLLSFEQLLEYGFISFYCDWLTVHKGHVRDTKNIHNDILPILHTLDTLQSTKFGNDELFGCHLIVKNSVVSGIRAELGLPEKMENCKFLSSDGVSTLIKINEHPYTSPHLFLYLWRELCKDHDSTQAIRRYVDICLSQFSYLCPPTLEYLEFEERNVFEDAFFDYFLDDAELGTPWHILKNRWVLGGDTVESIFIERKNLVEMTINIDDGTSSTRTPENKQQVVTFSLEQVLSRLNNLHKSTLSRWQLFGWYHRSHPYFRFFHATPYENIIRRYLDERIEIRNRTFYFPKKIQELLELSAKNPIIEHIIFNEMLSFQKLPDFALVLLSTPSTVAFGLNELIQRNRKTDDGVSDATRIECQRLLVKKALEQLPTMDASAKNDLLYLIRCLADDYASTEGPHIRNNEIITVFEQLNQEQIIELFLNYKLSVIDSVLSSNTPIGDMILLLKIIEKLKLLGMTEKDKFYSNLQKLTVNYLKTLFEHQWIGTSAHYLNYRRSISYLPWEVLSENSISKLINLLPKTTRIYEALKYEELGGSSKLRIKRKEVLILLVLAFVGYLNRLGQHVSKKSQDIITSKLLQIVEYCGFPMTANDAAHVSEEDIDVLFKEPFDEHEFDIWVPFCEASNNFSDEAFTRLVSSFDDNIPIERLQVLHHHTLRVNRRSELLDKIKQQSHNNLTFSSLTSLENSFYFAVSEWDTSLSKTILKEAKAFLSQRLKQYQKNAFLNEKKYKWNVLEYQQELLEIYESKSPTIVSKEQKLFAYPVPDFDEKTYYQRSGKTECQRFLRNLSGLLWLKEKPAKSRRIFAQLAKEIPAPIYIDNWLAACLNLLQKDQSSPGEYRKIEHEYKTYYQDFSTDKLSEHGLVNYLECLLNSESYTAIKKYWLSISRQKQLTIPVAHIYCQMLMRSGEPRLAKALLDELKKYHCVSALPGDYQKLVKELGNLINHNIIPERSVIETAQLNTGQSTIAQLRIWFNEITNRAPEEIAGIVSNQNIKSFLLDNVVSVCIELLARISNLHENNDKNKKQKESYKIPKKDKNNLTKEDNINQWFTSLFEQRLSTWGFSFKDGKQIGISPNSETQNSGILDGLICDKSNRPLAIYEAFRLFSNDLKVITDHLNKMSGYNSVGTDPIFIVSFCQVKGFAELSEKYAKTVSTLAYHGFDQSKNINNELEELERKRSTELRIYQEIRLRHGEKVTFYHLLLNFYLEYPKDKH